MNIAYIYNDNMSIKVEEKGCVLCQDSRRAKIEHDIRTGEMTKTVVAEELGIDVMVVFNHMNDHYGKGDDSHVYKDHSGLLETEIDRLYGKKKVLMDLIMDVKDRLEALKKIDSLKPADTNNILKTSGILLKAVELMAKLDGELTEERRVTMELYVTLKSAVLMAIQKNPGIQQEIISAISVTEMKAVKILDVKIPQQLETVIQG